MRGLASIALCSAFLLLACGEDVRLERRTVTYPNGKSVKEDWTFTRMNDQHGYVRVPDDSTVAVGDYVAMGISHPCTTFDRWPLLLEVDDRYRVVAALKTFF